MSTTTARIGRILIVEDDDAVSEALSTGLRSKGYEVEIRSTGKDIEQVIADFRPELLVLDLGLPDGPDGVSIAKRLRVASEAGVLFISGSHRIEDRLAGFAAGGDDFLTKPFSMAEFFARVEAIRRRALATNARYEINGLVIDEAAHTVTRDGDDIQLTPIEFSLLVALCRHPGRVRAKVELLDIVWGFDQFDVNLVEVHIHALRQKLEAFGPRLIQTVRGVGYVIRPAGDA